MTQLLVHGPCMACYDAGRAGTTTSPGWLLLAETQAQRGPLLLETASATEAQQQRAPPPDDPVFPSLAHFVAPGPRCSLPEENWAAEEKNGSEAADGALTSITRIALPLSPRLLLDW